MRMIGRPVAGTALLLAGLVLSPLMASSATAGSVPNSSDCTRVEPVNLLSLFNLVDDINELAGNSWFNLTVFESDLSIGDALPKEEQAAIEQTMNSFIACINARDPMRLLNLISSHYQAQMVTDLLSGADRLSVVAGLLPDVLNAPSASQPLQTPDIEAAWHPGGVNDTILAIVQMDVPGYTEPLSFLTVFVQSGETWKIDLIAAYERS